MRPQLDDSSPLEESLAPVALPPSPSLPPIPIKSTAAQTVLVSNPIQEVKKKSGCLKKILLSIGIFLGTLAVLGAIAYFFGLAILSLFVTDSAPINDSDLMPTAAQVLDKNNAFFDLKGIGDITDEPAVNLDYITLKKWDDADIASILAKNKVAFAKWDAASEKLAFQDPLYADLSIPPSFKPGYPTIYTGYQKIARLNILRGLAQVKSGSAESGINTIMEDVEMGQKLQQSKSGLVTDLVGVAIKSLGLQGLETVIGRLKFAPDAAIVQEKKLDTFPYDPDGLKEGLKQEYFADAYELDAMSKGNAKPLFGQTTVDGQSDPTKQLQDLAKYKFYFEPNKTKKLYADLFWPEIKNTDNPCTNIDDVPFHPDPTISFYWRFKENGVGQLLFRFGSTTYTGIVGSGCFQTVDLGAVKLLWALRAYELDKKTLPTTLDQLEPTYIASIPADPYDGAPMKYSASKKIIYSVGSNKKDDGGQGKFHDQNGLDYIIPINF